MDDEVFQKANNDSGVHEEQQDNGDIANKEGIAEIEKEDVVDENADVVVDSAEMQDVYVNVTDVVDVVVEDVETQTQNQNDVEVEEEDDDVEITEVVRGSKPRRRSHRLMRKEIAKLSHAT